MVNYKRCSVGRKVDVEFEEKGGDSGWGWRISRKGQEDIAILVDEVEQNLGGQRWPQPYYRSISILFRSSLIQGIPFDLGGRRIMWSKARSPCLNNESWSFLGDSNDSL